MLISKIDIILAIAVVLTGIISGFMAYKSIRRAFWGGNNSERQKKFNSHLFKCFNLDIIKSKNDIITAVNSHRLYSYPIVFLLEDFQKYIIDEYKNPTDSETAKLSSILEFLRDVFKEESQKRPFDDTPSEERRLLLILKDKIENNSFDNAIVYLKELGTAIKIRNKEYERSRKINKWSLPATVFGIILSVVLFFFALRNSINRAQMETTIRTVLADTANKTDSNSVPKKN